MPTTIWTVGHSTRPIGSFLALLSAHRVEVIADVRRFPASRRLPQFDWKALGEALEHHGVAYQWLPALGGRRKPDPDSVNGAWRQPGFRGYADHLATEEFAAGLFDLLCTAQGARTAVMCAEALWWRCHRRLIADVVLSLGGKALHIHDERRAEAHQLGPPARLIGGVLRYA